ncbi:MAG: hypothetical protein KAQ99_04570 [Candidatus Aureabacteria bacterium]|nr:hypothetical protein [Candidatus Auribacterota bacterium]
MKKSVYAKCPVCKTMLEVKTENGNIIRHFEPKENQNGKDALDSGLDDLKNQEQLLENAFKKRQEAEKTKETRLENTFKEKKKKVKEGSVNKPPQRPFDLD